MANQEQLDILKKGADVWNKWREENPALSFDLTEADLINADLVGVNLEGVNLNLVFLSGANLTNAILNNAVFIGADIRRSNFTNASVIGTSFRRANLKNSFFMGANLRNSDLVDANFQGCNLNLANLTKANLIRTNFANALLDGANFDYTELGETIFGSVNLEYVRNLEKAKHLSFSILSPSTMQLSHGRIPEIFLRGCGLSDWDIESVKLYNPDLSNEEINKIIYKVYDIRARQPIQISPLFISYSHADTIFVNKIEEYLIERGIRFWRDIHHATAGRLEKQIDRAINHNPTVLLVLSKNSINSDWVQHEVRIARELEKNIKSDVLCPIALDSTWKSSSWPTRIMEQLMEYNILDFSDWKDDDKFNGVFQKLIDGLNLYYQK